MTLTKTQLAALLQVVATASNAVLHIYTEHAAVATLKADDSPVTQADITAHNIILQGLTNLFPAIPIVSEEDNGTQHKKIVQRNLFWLVDPLDGTRDFLNRTDDFTVCVALIHDGSPIFGIIAAPAHGSIYYGGPGTGSYKKTSNKPPQRLRVSPKKYNVVLASRSHPSAETIAFIARHYPHHTIMQVGSQLKLPYIAEGLADVYPRIHSTMHTWDLAAGHAILLGAGGKVTRPDGTPIDYRNKTLQVGDFIASS